MTKPTNKTEAKKAGRRAAHKGIPYSVGRYIFNDSEAHLLLAWSQGHNQARADMIKRG